MPSQSWFRLVPLVPKPHLPSDNFSKEPTPMHHVAVLATFVLSHPARLSGVDRFPVRAAGVTGMDGTAFRRFRGAHQFCRNNNDSKNENGELLLVAILDNGNFLTFVQSAVSGGHTLNSHNGSHGTGQLSNPTLTTNRFRRLVQHPDPSPLSTGNDTAFGIEPPGK